MGMWLACFVFEMFVIWPLFFRQLRKIDKQVKECKEAQDALRNYAGVFIASVLGTVIVDLLALAALETGRRHWWVMDEQALMALLELVLLSTNAPFVVGYIVERRVLSKHAAS
ncbi:MAG TPA: hypothetical protein VHV55_18395 [Pirellulales bacterium]|jgi:hypothetical protein|nr:hypothetical protein [Pirellulales bacterium]